MFVREQGMLKGEYHCTVDLLFDRFGISCKTTDNFCIYLQNRLISLNDAIIIDDFLSPQTDSDGLLVMVI